MSSIWDPEKERRQFVDYISIRHHKEQAKRLDKILKRANELLEVRMRSRAGESAVRHVRECLDQAIKEIKQEEHQDNGTRTEGGRRPGAGSQRIR